MIRITPVEGITHRSLHFPDMPLAHLWCKGDGIELGAAAHNMFNLEGSHNFAPQEGDTLYRQAQLELCGEMAEVDVWAAMPNLPVPDHSYDYLISSHVFEHIPNFYAALDEVGRVLKSKGIWFTVIPKRDALPADVGRELTKLSQFRFEYTVGETVDSMVSPQGRRGHYYVWTLGSFIAAVNDHKPEWQLVASEETDSKVGNGHTFVYQLP